MARKKVEVVECSRCDRVEHRAEGTTEKLPHVLTVQFQPDAPGVDDLAVKFEDLCTPCMRTVRALVEQIGKRIEGVSPDRTLKPGKAPAEASVSSAPTVAKKAGPGPTGPVPHPAQPLTSKKPDARP